MKGERKKEGRRKREVTPLLSSLNQANLILSSLINKQNVDTKF